MFLTDCRMLLQSREMRRSRGRDSSSRSDQQKTSTANRGGVRNTIFQEEMDRMPRPRKGASTGVKRKMVKISDMVCAILSPEKRSRTPAIVVMNTADAPMPA